MGKDTCMHFQNENSDRPPSIESRRSFLRRAACLAIGAGILLVVGDQIGVLSVPHDGHYLETSITTNDPANTRAQLITVKVYYSMMAQYTDLTEEFFVIQRPTVLQDLMNSVAVRHPSMAQMMQMMLTLVDGVPAKSSASLNDGDVIQLIPLSAGG
ncbi:MAG: MoaD/ThiS family protein [Candidatus Bathyarchaeia archaeon]